MDRLKKFGATFRTKYFSVTMSLLSLFALANNTHAQEKGRRVTL